ncbi:hypothetical protein LXM56_13530 [Lysinibacillus fusiformis]|uniref:hypothetical protein n=1 Tax=Lysinibacillus fusiformis TaxID=28031 RepID=UPI001E49B739|nr:hypothetical protein [Lysinibacillus fusiformis]MCE4045155.1 hypothetical protein [Lysinibacillus fusiformis]
MNVEIDKLIKFLGYVYEGMDIYPFQAFTDDKEYKDKNKGTTFWDINKLRGNLKDKLCSFLKRCDLEKRALCFYMNGAKDLIDVKYIRFHFVDIDAGGGTKEEQLERIMNAPLKPTFVYEGRSGYKALYAVKEAHWDNSTQAALNESKYIFEKIQFQLIGYFKGDRSKRHPNDCFRLPYTNNYKEFSSDGKVYQERIVYRELGNVYTQQELSEAFPPGEEPNKNKNTRLYNGSDPDVLAALASFRDNLEISGLDYFSNGKKVMYQCPIHSDGKPSAYMYYDSLICHCSNGDNGECAIGKGKYLSWVAEQLGWDDLLEIAKKVEMKPGEKYAEITLQTLDFPDLMPLRIVGDKYSTTVTNVVSELVDTMQKRKITLDENTLHVYSNLVAEINSNEPGISVFPLEPGGGKSTTYVAYLKYMLMNNFENAGTIIVVERNETAEALAKELVNCRVCLEANDTTPYDADHCLLQEATYVMQSAYTYKKCKKKPIEYEHNLCGRCSFRKGCPLPMKYEIQKQSPIVIMTHARLQMDGGRLSKYATWKAKDGKEYKRSRIIIDEKPPMLDVITVSPLDLEMLIFDLKSMEMEIGSEMLSHSIEVVNNLKATLLSSVKDEKLAPLDESFAFGFDSIWYKLYSGNNVGLLKNVEAVINLGGAVNEYNNKISITTSKKVAYDFSLYNTTILDGTAINDLEYQYFSDFNMLDVPRLKSYSQLTLHIDNTISSSKTKLMDDPELIVEIAKYTREMSIEKPVLLLCYKSLRENFENLLIEEVKKKRVAINHFGNVKGSNSYSNYSCVVIAGIVNKGEPYYMNKSGKIFSDDSNLDCTTINKVRRFNDVSIEQHKLSDQFVSLVQDILRTSIRNNGSTQEAEVFLFSRDTVLTKMLHEYFVGSKIKKWDLLGLKPSWYDPISELFSTIGIGEKINKKAIRDMLNLEGEAGKKQMQRILKRDEFISLLRLNNIDKWNTKAFVKVNVKKFLN